VSVMETAGEGGPWGMALLAAYRVNREEGETLDAYLNNKVFGDNKGSKAEPDAADAEGFNAYTKLFVAGLEAEKAATKSMR